MHKNCNYCFTEVLQMDKYCGYAYLKQVAHTSVITDGGKLLNGNDYSFF